MICKTTLYNIIVNIPLSEGALQGGEAPRQPLHEARGARRKKTREPIT